MSRDHREKTVLKPTAASRSGMDATARRDSKSIDPPADLPRETAWALLAKLSRPHGRRGELVADILTDFPDRFHERHRLFLIPPDRVVMSPREVRLESFWYQRSRIVLKFEGVDSINDAEGLRDCTVAIPASERAPLEKDEVYVGDLIGCHIIDLDQDGENVGKIVDVDRRSSNTDLLVVRRACVRGHAEEALIPLAKQYLERIDAANRRVEMRLPKGLLEINAPMTEEEKRDAGGRER